MTYEHINSILVSKIPELKESIEEVTNYWKHERVPSHVLFAEVFYQNSFMYNLLSEECNIAIIRKVFDFFEDMANSNDAEVRNLLQVSILEYLWDDLEVLSRAHKYMHTKTRALSDELQTYLKPSTVEDMA